MQVPAILLSLEAGKRATRVIRYGRIPPPVVSRAGSN